ncbi:MAG: rod shape-determining protein MreD [Candidatus Omnitrophota bacterium]|nr:rod shape-determining protein MreD [Candidatus Omnitrophota bacterium]
MKRFPLYVILIFAFLIQLLFLDRVNILGVKPDLLVILAVFFAVFFGPFTGAEAGFISGLLKDIYSLDTFGVNSVLLSLTGFIVGGLSPKFFKESKLTQVLLVFVSSVLYMIAHYLVSSLILKIAYVTLSEYLYGLILPSSFYTAMLSLIVFPVLIDRYRLKNDAEYL